MSLLPGETAQRNTVNVKVDLRCKKNHQTERLEEDLCKPERLPSKLLGSLCKPEITKQAPRRSRETQGPWLGAGVFSSPWDGFTKLWTLSTEPCDKLVLSGVVDTSSGILVQSSTFGNGSVTIAARMSENKRGGESQREWDRESVTLDV